MFMVGALILAGCRVSALYLSVMCKAENGYLLHHDARLSHKVKKAIRAGVPPQHSCYRGVLCHWNLTEGLAVINPC